MRYLYILFLITGLSISSAYAQLDTAFHHTEKGSHLAGGTISLSSSSAGSSNVFGANLNPNYGYFVANRLAIGGVLSLSYSQSSSSDGSALATLSPFVRYYIGPAKPVMVFGYASAGGGIVKSNNTSNSLYSFQVGPGVDYFINEHVALEGLFTYRGSQINADSQNYSNSFGILIGLQIFF